MLGKKNKSCNAQNWSRERFREVHASWRERDGFRDAYREAHAKNLKSGMIKRFLCFVDIDVSVTVPVTRTVKFTRRGKYDKFENITGSIKRVRSFNRQSQVLVGSA
jgi:hypothetical protein